MRLSNREEKIIRNYFADKPVLKAYVFGSYARGDADKDSDIDLLIQLDYSQRIGLKYVSMQLELENLLRKRVDFSSADFLKPRIKSFIEGEKKLVYEKTDSRHPMA